MTTLQTVLRLIAAALCLGLAWPAQADELRPGYMELTQQTQTEWKLVWKAPILGGMATRAEPLLPDFCRMDLGAARLSGLAVVARGKVTCARPLDGATVGLKGMEPGSIDALLRVAPLGRPVMAQRLTAAESTFTVSAVPDGWQVARTYFIIGVEHILAGFDHLLFVIALVLLLQRGWAVVAAATAFTLAHSITLAGTTLGLFGLPQAPVEASIALSIVFLAVEIAKARPGAPRLSERLPWLVAFLFGLLHGFGFAGALREIGLPEGDVPVALLTFNLGVEAGQMVVIAVTAGVLAALARFAPLVRRPAVLAATYGIGAVASFWFIERIWT